MFDGVDTVARIFLLGPDLWPNVCERVRPHFQRMADGSGGRYLLEDVEDGMFSGRMGVWLIFDGSELAAVIATEIVAYPRMKVMRYVGVSGHRPGRWFHLQSYIEEAARNLGCQRMETLHSPVHQKLTRVCGYRPWHCMSEKDL